MTEQDVKEFVSEKIAISLTGGNVEANKFDCKSKWYNLLDNEDRHEFLKDACAIINSYGGADGFIVIGYDERRKVFQDSVMSDCGYNDDRYIVNLIRGKVDRAFNINIVDFNFLHPTNNTNHKLSIIHIPPSLQKPHVITEYVKDKVNYLNEIFVRNGSNNGRATKADLDNMYIERPTIVLDKSVQITISRRSIKTRYSIRTQNFEVTLQLYLENRGMKDVDISALTVTALLSSPNTPIEYQKLIFSFIAEQSVGRNFFRLVADDPIHVEWSFTTPLPNAQDGGTLRDAVVIALNKGEFSFLHFKLKEPNGNVTDIVPNII